MERETITIETPFGKHKVAIKKWLTGKEVRELRKPFLEKMALDLDVIDNKTQIKTNKIDGNFVEETENKVIEIMVESVDGEKENILEKVLEMREEDYNFVMEKINEVKDKMELKKKKQ